MKYKIAPMKITKRPKHNIWNVEELKNEKTRQEFQNKVYNRLIAAGIDPSWDEVISNIRQSAVESIGFRKLNPRKPWITNEIMDLIKYRNKLKKTDDAMYRIVKNRITQKCRDEKEKWMDLTCENIKINTTANRMDKAYGIIKKLSRLLKPRSKIVKDRNGKLILEEGEITTRCKEYIEDLYKGLKGEDDMNIENITESNKEDVGPIITKDEFVKALRELKQGKAAGVDNIPAELLKNVGKNTEHKLYEMTEKMYRDGNIPKDFAKSKIVLIPKKGNSTECNNYRTISLLTHASKILLIIIKNRIQMKIEKELDKDQFGFRQGIGIREEILAIRVLTERRLNVNRNTFITFIDLEKAFDTVNWALLMSSMMKTRIDWRDRRIIMLLYKEQETLIEVEEHSTTAKIKRGIRQGCSLSPYLFNIFVEEIMDKYKRNSNGTSINGEKIRCIRFADDIALVSESEKDMQKSLTTLTKILQEYQMKINAKKTKTMVVTKAKEIPVVKVEVNNHLIEQVQQFKNLGSTITSDGKCSIEIRQRIAMAKRAFTQKRQLLTNKKLNINMRKNFVKCYVWSVLLYLVKHGLLMDKTKRS
uniref:LINE-1 reverse transcriptase n=1 Tax=Sipha flava TaxID=143950 RepID=A0A2S2QSL5_9HEMI